MLSNWPDFGNSLFDQLWRWDRNFDDFFPGLGWEPGIRASSPHTYPPINVGDSPEQVDVYVFAAAINPDSWDVSVRQNLLTVSGEREHEQSDNTFYRRERFSGRFQRVVTLPEDVDPDHVEAHYRNGVLHVTIKRKESATPRRIEVN